jgi:hypothetical protein
MSGIEEFFLNNIYPYSRSIVYESRRGRPEFVGSGFCLNTSDGVYLITASHVMDHHFFDGKDLFFEYADRLIRIRGEELSKNIESKTERNYDKFDISIIKLDESIQPYIRGNGVVDPDIVSLHGIEEYGHDFTCIGIPANIGNRGVSRIDSTIDVNPYGFIAKEGSIEAYEKLNLSRKSHLVLRFDTKRAYNLENRRTTAPALNGLSGSPVWCLHVTKDRIVPKIVAILIEYHKRHKLVVCTRVSEIIGGGSLLL